jgi:hypothetical protein
VAVVPPVVAGGSATLLSTLMEVSARMLPTNTDPLFRVAELPSCQKTLHSCAPLISATVLPTSVMRVEFVWKTNTELGSPAPSRVTLPVNPNGDLLGPAYTPAPSVLPPRSAVVVAFKGRPAAFT